MTRIDFQLKSLETIDDEAIALLEGLSPSQKRDLVLLVAHEGKEPVYWTSLKRGDSFPAHLFWVSTECADLP